MTAAIYDLENWAGPFKTKDEAIAEIRSMCGTGYRAAIWQKSPGVWYINDGIDLNAERIVPWKKLPKNAGWVRV